MFYKILMRRNCARTIRTGIADVFLILPNRCITVSDEISHTVFIDRKEVFLDRFFETDGKGILNFVN